jgi:hypothetical protein
MYDYQGPGKTTYPLSANANVLSVSASPLSAPMIMLVWELH